MSRGFKGVITALITPFYNGEVDYGSFAQLINFQLERGVEGFVVNGTTGESPALEKSEVQKLFEVAKTEVGGKVPLILGTGSNATKKTQEMTYFAQELKADAALVVVPYYNKPTQKGMVAHYKAVAESTELPVLLYNVPGRTIVSLSVDSVVELSETKNIVGIKEASGDLAVLKELKNRCPPTFLLTSGDDASCIEFMLGGGEGVISVISNILPKQISEASHQARRGEGAARESYAKLNTINNLLSLEPNPIPVKAAAFEMGLIRSPELRLPLIAMEESSRKKIRLELEKLGAI